MAGRDQCRPSRRTEQTMSFDQRLGGLALHRTRLRLFCDVLLLGLLLLVAENFNRLWGGTTRRGFFCDDESLMHPYHENTVSSNLLHWLGLYLPLAALLLLEAVRIRRAGSEGWQRFWPAYNTLRWFVFGHVAETLLKDMGKKTIGRLRPHFFDVCRPQLPDGGFCTDEAHSQDRVYHLVYTCREDLSGATAEMLRDVHVSFPSGHSSMAFYGLLFLALHLQRIRWSPPGSMVRPACQLFLFLVALFVALSRVMDYKHHWSDVLAGSLLGASTAIVVIWAAEQEQRLQLQQEPQSLPHANPASTPAPLASPAGTGADQPAHDLCAVTCHSSS